MGKIAILADTGCGLTDNYLEKDTYMLPLYVHFSDKSYKDMVEISSNEVYEKMDREGLAKTSIPSVGEIKQMIEKIKSDGYTDILVISLSSGLSGVHNAICMAAKEEQDINIKIVDTKNVWLGTGFFVLYAQDLLKENPQISIDELYEKVNNIYNSKLYFYLDTFKYLIAGGRIGKVVGTVGTLLKIMPIIACNDEGIYHTVSKTRSEDKAIADITDRIKEFVSKNVGKKHYIAIVYKKDERLLKKIEEILKDEIMSAVKYIKYDVVTPALGVHSGPGALGVGAFCY
ncbi:MAG: DegV family protein [Peptoanaerobacter stomatis]|uniref:DegV family protein n=1 Tax=Peptoanaerobacter stomatis TaxID=796937 RepID=UPI003F9F9562